jgi:hypothetical protein
MMTFSITVLQLLIFSIGIAEFLLFFILPEHGTRTFRWTAEYDMNDRSCARAFRLEKKSNRTSNNSSAEDNGCKYENPFVFLRKKI